MIRFVLHYIFSEIYFQFMIIQVGEGRALYNLGNVYHTKAKNLGHLGSHDPGNFPDDVKNCLEMAINYYKYVKLDQINMSSCFNNHPFFVEKI